MLPHYSWLDQSRCFDDAVLDSGWNALIRDLLRHIDGMMAGKDVRLEARQLKEKMGALHFYYRLHNASPTLEQEIADACEAAYQSSKLTCFECGKPGNIRNQIGWIIPLCDQHV